MSWRLCSAQCSQSQKPLAQTLRVFLEAAKRFDGTSLTHGDVSAEVPALVGIPITYILWAANEFSAEASVLFDESATAYLPTEDLAVLGELYVEPSKKKRQPIS